MLNENELKVFSGNAHPQLANDVCRYLGIPLGESEAFKFANDNTFVRIRENIRERDVFIVQPTMAPTNDNLMEMLIMIDACKRASAGRITAVISYYGYGRTDKKDQPRVPITARLVADLISTAGADRVLTLDLHAGQIQGFFNIPVDELTAEPILSNYFVEKGLDDLVLVAVDFGISKRARDMAERLGVPVAVIEKAAHRQQRPLRDPQRHRRRQGQARPHLRRRNPHRRHHRQRRQRPDGRRRNRSLLLRHPSRLLARGPQAPR